MKKNNDDDNMSNDGSDYDSLQSIFAIKIFS